MQLDPAHFINFHFYNPIWRMVAILNHQKIAISKKPFDRLRHVKRLKQQKSIL